MASADRTYDDVKKNPALISVTTAKEKIALYDGWTAYEQVGSTFKISTLIHSRDIALNACTKIKCSSSPLICLYLKKRKKKNLYIF